MAGSDEKLPVLNDVTCTVETSIIGSKRFQSSAEQRADSANSDTPHVKLPAHLRWEGLGIQNRQINPHCKSVDELKDRNDQITDKPIVALRKDLSILLDHA